jgi:hypothetical protein
MESATMNLQERLEQIFAQKALPKKVSRLERMSLGELLYLALLESADSPMTAQA